MPYITEELYQRIPGVTDDNVPSICVAPYPVPSQVNSIRRKEMQSHFPYYGLLESCVVFY